MELTMKDKKTLVKAFAPRYRKATKKQKQTMLNEFVQITGYHRTYAAYLLNQHGKRLRLNSQTTLVLDACPKIKRQRPAVYDPPVQTALKTLWKWMDHPCGKRMVAMIPLWLPRLEPCGEIQLGTELCQKLHRISAATIDRLLAPERAKRAFRRRSHTQPDRLLKSQIPIRTFAQWNEQRPGFAEVDLVGHEGGNASGEFCYTLTLTDVYTGWTEVRAIKNKAQRWTLEALQKVRQQLPFPLLGLDSDNGSEFINAHLKTYCEANQITFTRARPTHKNDNCYVEQKNNAVVRRRVGYFRYDTPEALATLNQLYAVLRFYLNYFQPTMKLVEKVREGSRVRKRYTLPQTPYERVLACEHVSSEAKQRLRQQQAQLNPAVLYRTIRRLQQRLFELASPPQEQGCSEVGLEYLVASPSLDEVCLT